MKSKSIIPLLVIFLLVILGLIGGYLISYGTHWGPWTTDDTAEYFEAARNLAAGKGVVLIRASGAVRPLSARLPLYPIILSTSVFYGIDMVGFARWLDIVLFVLLILILGLGTYSHFRKPLLSICLSALVLSSPAFLSIYSAALSEPLFYTLGVASLFLLVPYFERSSLRLLTIAAILAGLASLSRYAGAIFVLSGIAGLLIFSHRSFLQRILETAYFSFWSGILLLPWLLGVYRAGEAPATSNFTLENLWVRLTPVRVGFVEVIWNWVPFQSALPSLHYRIKLVVLVVVVVLVLGSLFFAIRRRSKYAPRSWRRYPLLQLTMLFMLFVIFYAVMIAITNVFLIYPQGQLIEKHMAPIQLGASIVFLLIAYILIEVYRGNKVLKLLPIAVTCLAIASNIPLSRDELSDLHANGRGLTSSRWRSSEVLGKVSELPEDITLISNEAEAIVFWINRPAHRVPEIYKQQPVESYRRFGEDSLDSVQVKFRENGAALILFESAYWQFQQIYEEETEKRLEVFTDGLYKYFEGSDGAIYFYEEKFRP